MKKHKQTKPLVSVILPVFKSERYLEACLKSLSQQTFKNFEIVAVVDYLGDKSFKILRKYKKKEPRLRIYSNLQRYGLASTLNRAIEKAAGQYIAFMDSAGTAHRQRISKQTKHLLANPKIAAVGTQINLINEKDKRTGKSDFPLYHEEIYSHLIGAASLKFETVMVDKTRLPRDILRFKKNTPYPYVYIDVFVRIGKYAEISNLKEKLVSIRQISKEGNQVLNMKKQLGFLKTLFESTTDHEYKPSLSSLLSPILR